MIEENQEKIVTDIFFIYLKIIFIVCKKNCQYNEDNRKGKYGNNSAWLNCYKICEFKEVKA